MHNNVYQEEPLLLSIKVLMYLDFELVSYRNLLNAFNYFKYHNLSTQFKKKIVLHSSVVWHPYLVSGTKSEDLTFSISKKKLHESQEM